WLVLASLFFYGWWNPLYLPLILMSMAVNYNIGAELNLGMKSRANKLKSFALSQHLSRKKILILGIAFNVGLLGYFKYMDFFISNLNNVLDANIPLQNLVLPLAISFFTFQQIAYLVDSYRRETQEYNAINYML